MKLSVIGLGKLGLCTAACFAKAGYHVLGIDINPDHIGTIKSGKLPFEETGLDTLLQQIRDHLEVNTDISAAVATSDITFIIVPTPSTADGSFTNQYVKKVLADMAPVIKEKNEFHIIDVVSTVMPGSCENEFIPFLEKETGKQAGIDFGLAYNPEFIAIGSVIRNFLNPDLVLIGASDARTREILLQVYQKTCDNSPYMAVTSLINAEIAKLSINCYCTMKISFANNLGMICDKIPGASASEITGILGNDTRIGDKYIKPGLGFGGPCFPRDNEAFIRFARDIGGYPGLQEAVVNINRRKTDQAVNKILKTAEIVGDKVAVLGLSYKPATYLTECSQSVDIITALADCGKLSDLSAYDPMAKKNGKWRLANSLQSCVSGMNVAAILTPWPEFFQPHWQNEMAGDRAVLNFWE
jgi:UDPglucose 6-dehydrogenase